MGDSLPVIERSVVGAILSRGSRLLDDINLDPADFDDPRCEAVYRFVLEMHSHGKAIDASTVDQEMRSDPDFQVPGIDFTWLYDSVTNNTRFNYVDDYVEVIKAAAVRRRVRQSAVRVANAADADMDVEELVDMARREMEQAGQIETDKLESLHSSMLTTLDNLTKPVKTVLSPWADLNSMIGGFAPGRLYVVGARPAVGKSLVALQAALALAQDGFVSFVSLEMSKDEINKRIISHDLEIQMDKLMSGSLSERDWAKIKAHMDHWSRSKLMVNDDPGVTFASLRKHARTVSKRGKLSGIVVDYLQLLSAPRGDMRKRHEVVSDFSRNLKLLARDLEVPVIALSQLNRESAGRSDNKPRITDLRESGAVEQDADVVILLHRELLGDTRKHMQMSVAKNRQGRTGTIDLDFYGEHSTVVTQGARRQSGGPSW